MSTTKRIQTILIVDDLRTNALALSRVLKTDWNIQTAQDGPTALTIANSAPPPDIILLDIQMPGMDGYEVCRRLKQSETTRDIPVVFITAMDGQEDEAYGLELGVVDYITKPIHAPIVKARIRNHLALQQVRAELAIKNIELEKLASHDKLTNLYNRRKIDESFDREITRAERYGRPLSVILLDIDHFKRVNDTFGHPVGDLVLAETSARLQAALRSSDIPGRWGGEEFLIICPETNLETTVMLAERLRDKFSASDFPEAGRLTASFGVATHRKGRNASDILQSVDEALYRAKNNGRNQVAQEAY